MDQPLEKVELAVITAQSRKQAMEWSLALISQGIEAIIQKDEETRKWELLVPPGDYERALETIKVYRLENRGWNWRGEVPGAKIEIHWGVVPWCLLLTMVHLFATSVSPALELNGQMSSALVRNGEWQRLFTAVMLHGDLGHLFANVTFGLVILGLAMARYGWGVALLATYLAGAAGNVFGLYLYERPYTGLGASGMMMGALGLLCVHSVGLWRKSPKTARYILSGVIAGFLLFVLFGFSPKSDVVAHTGGFFAGAALGLGLAFAPPPRLESTPVNLAAITTLAALIAATWLKALL